MDKERKILDQFCKKVAEKGMSIFAQDAAPAEKPEWITMNGTHIHVGEGETPESAGKKFAAAKENERASMRKPSAEKQKSSASSVDVKALNVQLAKAKRKTKDAFDNVVNLQFSKPNSDELKNAQKVLRVARTEEDRIREKIHNANPNKPVFSQTLIDLSKRAVEGMEAHEKFNNGLITQKEYFNVLKKQKGFFENLSDAEKKIWKDLSEGEIKKIAQTGTAETASAKPIIKMNASQIPKQTSLKDLEVKLSQKRSPLSKKEQAVHNSMMDLIHEQHQYEINRRDYLDAQKTMKQLENTYRGKFTPEYQKAKQKADAALTKYSFALQKFRDLQSKMKKEHGIELTDKL